MKKVKVDFEHDGYDVTAQGFVQSEVTVVGVNLYFKDIDKSDYPKGEELQSIKDLAEELLVEKAYNPEVEFDY